MTKIKRLFLPLMLIVALLFTGCSIILEEDETTADTGRETNVSQTEGSAESETSATETESEPEPETETETEISVTEEALDRDGSYTTADDVALYLYTYGELPGNFMTKNEARALGWEGGSLEAYAPGMCIGGDYYGNYEGNLPEAAGREYHECDINTLGASSRGAERLVFSNDGLIYYTADHYETFTLLYGVE